MDISDILDSFNRMGIKWLETLPDDNFRGLLVTALKKNAQDLDRYATVTIFAALGQMGLQWQTLVEEDLRTPLVNAIERNKESFDEMDSCRISVAIEKMGGQGGEEESSLFDFVASSLAGIPKLT